MENNLPISGSAPNETNYSISVKHKPETPYLITEGRVENLEQIADQIERFEKWEPKWDAAKMIMSACGAIFLCGLGIIVPDLALPPMLSKWAEIFTFGAFLGLSISFVFNCLHNKERKEQYQNEAQKIKNILAKVRSSIEQS